MRNTRLLSNLVVASLVLGGASVGLAQRPGIMRMVNKPAPEFSLTLFSGGKVELKNYRGKVVVLNFWHSG